ncbi:hypothetical protein ACFLRQ_02640 [Bacteroidota bacterium]
MEQKKDSNQLFREFNAISGQFTEALMEYIKLNPNDPRNTEIFEYCTKVQDITGEWLELVYKWGNDETLPPFFTLDKN